MNTPERVAVLEPDNSLCKRIFGIIAKFEPDFVCEQFCSYIDMFNDRYNFNTFIFNENSYMQFVRDKVFSSYLSDAIQRSYMYSDDEGNMHPVFLLHKEAVPSPEKLSKEIEAAQDDFLREIFLKLGFRHNLTGCRYLKAAIKLASSDSSYLNKGITKRLYPKLAEMFGSNPSSIERGIRHTLSVCFDNGKFKSQSAVFGNCFDNSHCPTNGEFIALMADMLSTKIKNHFSPKDH